MMKSSARRAAVCQQCKEKKIRCDDRRPHCTPCHRAQQECLNLDPATGAEIPRDYIAILEQKLAKWEESSREEESPRSSTSQSHKPATILDDADRLGNKQRMQASDVLNDDFVDGLFCGAEEELSSTGEGSTNDRHAGIHSFLQQSSSSFGSTFDGIPCSEEELDRDDQGGQASSVSTAEADTFPAPVSAASSPFSEADGGREEPSFDAFHIARTIGAEDYTKKGKAKESTTLVEQEWSCLRNAVLQAEFDEICSIYFDCINCQVPVLDKSSFESYVKVVRAETDPQNEMTCVAEGQNPPRVLPSLGSMPSVSTHGNSQVVDHLLPTCDCERFTKASTLSMVLAIGYASRRKKASQSSKDEEKADRYYKSAVEQRAKIMHHGQSGTQHNLFGNHGSDSSCQHGELQTNLLLCLYSMICPVAEGTWHFLGTIMRHCTALRLHTESAPNDGTRRYKLLVEEGRRLFWASYCLDRYVSISLRMPLALGDTVIQAPLPWMSAEKEKGVGSSSGSCHPPSRKRRRVLAEDRSTLLRADFAKMAQEEYEQLWAEMRNPISADPQRCISVFFIKLRQLQSEVFSVLSERSSLPATVNNPSQWHISIQERLKAWKRFAPLHQDDIDAVNCRFSARLLQLNLHQTELLYLGLDVNHTKLQGVERLGQAALNVIKDVCEIEEMGYIHFTWITLHNLCVASIFYLFCAWQTVTTVGLVSFRARHGAWFVKSEEVELISSRVVDCMKSIGKRCSAGKSFRRSLPDMFRSTRDLLRRYEESERRKSRRYTDQADLTPLRSLFGSTADHLGSTDSGTAPWLHRIRAQVTKPSAAARMMSSDPAYTHQDRAEQSTPWFDTASNDVERAESASLRFNEAPLSMEGYFDFINEINFSFVTDTVKDMSEGSM